MLKASGRFFLLLILCCTLVYAPEIFSAVSRPYALSVPERTLLRIVLCIDSEAASSLHAIINQYQKDRPSVHLRVAPHSVQQLSQLTTPYPDVIVCSQPLSTPLPSCFIPVANSNTPFRAFFQETRLSTAASDFASYIVEASSSQSPPPEI